MRERGIRKPARRRGADMTNALLWSAFLMVVLIGIFMGFQQVRFSQAKQEVTQTYARIGAELDTWPQDYWRRNVPSYIALLTDLGVIDVDKIIIEGPDAGALMLPYGGVGRAYGPVGGNGSLDFQIVFNEPSRNARALCSYLLNDASADPRTGVVTAGPLGSNYQVWGDCQGESSAYLDVSLRVSDPARVF